MTNTSPPSPIVTSKNRARELSLISVTVAAVWTPLLLLLIQLRGEARPWEPAMLALAPIMIVAGGVGLWLTRPDSP